MDAQTQNTQYLFQNLTNKTRVFTNLDNNAGRIPALNELIVNRVGAHVMQAFGNTVTSDADIIKLAHAAYVRFAVNQSRLVVDAPLFTLQSGLGVTGSTTRNDTGVVTIGVASAAAAPQLLVAQPIGPNDSISGSDSYIAIQQNNWSQSGNINGTPIVPQPNILPTFATSLFVWLGLDGLIKKPATA